MPSAEAKQIDTLPITPVPSRALPDAMALRSLSLTLLRQAWLPSCSSSSSCSALGIAAEAASTSLRGQAAAAASSSRPSSRPTNQWAQALRGYTTAPPTEPVET